MLRKRITNTDRMSGMGTDGVCVVVATGPNSC